jgi:prophage regulatory protein
MIKNNGTSEPLLPRSEAPPLQPDGGDRAPDEPRPRRMLNEKQVLEIIPVSRSTLWRLEKQGKFPRSTYISSNRRFWFADEVTEWQNRINGQGRHGRPKG